MKLKKSYLRKLIKEELKHLLLEFDLVDDETQAIEGEPSETDAGHFDYDKGEDEVFEEDDDGWEGPGKKGKYRPWADKRRTNPKKSAAKKRPYGGGAGINPGGNPDPKAPMPDYMRGKTRNPKTGKDEPYEEGLRRRPKRQKRRRK